MKIAVLTYDIPHRKTQDVLFRLLIAGYKPMIIAMGWQERKSHKPLYNHRPQLAIDVSPYDFSATFGLRMYYIKNYADLDRFDFDYLLIGGAGIIKSLPEYPVINAHPGYLTHARGLDALKWSIYYGVQTGVTIHKIDEQIDSGDILYQEQINPLAGEQFFEFAMRIYEAEVRLLVEHFTDGVTSVPCSIYDTHLPGIMKRMPVKTELQMMKRYDNKR